MNPMIFSVSDEDRLNKSCPLFGATKLGSKLQKLDDVLEYEVETGAADIKIFNNNAPVKFEIVDVVIQARGASTNGTMKLTDGSNDITDAIVCAADNTIGRAGTIDDAYSTIEKGGTLQIVCAGDTVANTKGLVIIKVRKR